MARAWIALKELRFLLGYSFEGVTVAVSDIATPSEEAGNYGRYEKQAAAVRTALRSGMLTKSVVRAD